MIESTGTKCPEDGFPFCQPDFSGGFFGTLLHLFNDNPFDDAETTNRVNQMADNFVDEVQDSVVCHVADLAASDAAIDGLLGEGAPVAIDENSAFLARGLAGKISIGMAKSQNGKIIAFSTVGVGAGVGQGGGKTESVANQLPSSGLSTTLSGGLAGFGGEFSAELQGSDFRSGGLSAAVPKSVQYGGLLTFDFTLTTDCTEILK